MFDSIDLKLHFNKYDQNKHNRRKGDYETMVLCIKNEVLGISIETHYCITVVEL